MKNQYMLCRNRVKDFSAWKKVFDSHAGGHAGAGLRLIHLWREKDAADQVHFLFEVHDLAKALAFVSSPEGAETGRRAGVLEGDIRILEEVALA